MQNFYIKYLYFSRRNGRRSRGGGGYGKSYGGGGSSGGFGNSVSSGGNVISAGTQCTLEKRPGGGGANCFNEQECGQV